MSAPILRTKLFVPPLQPTLVERERLLTKLENGRSRKLTIVSAPAGFGKTTLITRWIQQKTAVWLALDGEDNDPARFITYVIATLRQVDPAFGEQILTLLQANPNSDTVQISTIFLNDLSYLDEPVCLVLDDYHLIENEVIHEMLSFWLTHLPPQLHLIITSRADLPFSISKLRVRQQVKEIRAADLRFTPAETAVFLNDLMGLNLTTDDVAALEARTEGWIASLQLAALSLSQQGQSAQSTFIQQFSGSNRFVMDYLVDEILHQLDADTREFLIETAVFDRLCADLCDVVRQTTNAQQMITQLEQANLFLIPLDDHQQWFRYHHLFADFLRHRFLQNPLAQREQLHQRATAWFTDNDLLDEAIAHALTIEDFSTAANLMADYSADLLVRGEVGKMMHWINLLPAGVPQQNRRLGIFYAWALIFTGQFGAVVDFVVELEKLGDTPTWPMQAYVTVINGFLATRNGRFAEGIALTQDAVAQLNKFEHQDDIHAIMVGAAEINLADSYMLSNQFDKAYQQYQTAVTVNRETGNILAGLGAVKALADLTIAKGQLHKAQDILQQGMQMAQYWQAQLPIPGTKLLAAAPLQATLGLLHYQWNDLAKARPLIEEAAEMYKLGGAINEAEGIAALIHLRWAEGNLSAINHLLEQFRLLAENHPHDYTQQRVQCAIIEWKIRLAKSDPQWHYYRRDIEEWIDNTPLSADDIPYVNEFFFFTYALALLYLGQSERLLPLLHQLKHIVEASNRLGDLARLQMMQLLLFVQNKNTAVSLEILTSLLNQTETEGYIRLFVDEGQIIADLLRQLPATPYRDHLLTQFPKTENANEKSSPSQLLVEPLSERELEVLALIADGATNQQIADQLVIAKSTAKKHVSNIIGKLGVENRTAAIARARELGLII